MALPATKASFVWPVRPHNFIWIAVVGAVLMAASIFGTPHLRYQYVWNGNPDAPRYFACDYVGLHPFHLEPAAGECPTVMLVRGDTESEHG
jgi:hypothetical protein